VVLSVRGTKELADVLTDALMDTAPFEGGFAHTGVVRASAALCESYAEMLRAFETKGYEVVVVGHSLGAATAAAVTIQLRRSCGLRQARCACFAPPPTVDAKLAKECAPYLMSVVHDDDFIPRSQVASLLAVYRELLVFDWLPAARQEAEALLELGPEWLKATMPPSEVLARVEGALESRMTRWRESRSAMLAKMDDLMGSADGKAFLYVPGFVLHVVRADSAAGYRAAKVDAERLRSVELSESMVFDHFMDGYLGALRALAGAARAGADQDAQLARSVLPEGAPQEALEAVAAAVKLAHSFRSKALRLMGARPDTS